MPKAARDALKASGAKGKRDAYMFDPDDLVLVTDKTSPLYDDRTELPLDEGLVLNMMFAPDGVPQGVLEPILAARNNETGKVEVVDGRQRVKAAREANKRLAKQGAEPIRVPAMIQRASGHRLMAMLISPNEHRQADSPLGRARKAQRYLALGRDESEVATLFGITKSSVKNLLSLLDAPAAVRNAVESGKITASDGYKLARLEPAEAREKVTELIEKAPRMPGKKRSKNAKKAREIVSGGNGSGRKTSAAAVVAEAPPPAAASEELVSLRRIVSAAVAMHAECPADPDTTKEYEKTVLTFRESLKGANGKALVDVPDHLAFAIEAPNGDVTKKLEDSAANDIAAWLKRRWKETPEDLVKELRAGKWREA